MSHARYLAVCAALALCAVAVYALLRANAGTSLPERDSYWYERIKDAGGEDAYRELASAVADLSPQHQHEEAHAFGGALFAAEGVQGLSVCDASFSFGCFHEFLGRAIAALGLSSVPELNERCFQELSDSPLSCQHGIGHGIMAHLGYDDEALRESLALCRDLAHADSIGGCYGGVFMEYNVQTMLGEDGRIRPMGEDAQYPCSVLPEEYGAACYFWQPQWWRQVLVEQGEPDASVHYAQIGMWCEGAPARFLRECFEGIGNNIPPDAGFDGARARELCEAATNNPERQLYCKSLAANSLFVGGAGKTGDALALCEGLSGEAAAYCEAYARNEANIMLPKSALDAL